MIMNACKVRIKCQCPVDVLLCCANVTDDEGCLSVIDFMSNVDRYQKIKITAQDLEGNPLEFESVDLEIHGDVSEKIDILFVAEGYTQAEMDKFLVDVTRSADYIFSEEPFQSHREKFNVRAVLSFSKDSGTDIPGQGVWKNTVINSSFYTFGIERYMTTMDFKSVCDVAANAHYDQIYILVNTDKYGGGGIYNHYSISAADNEASRAVVIHEFGHAFGGLADEYYNSAVAYNDYFPLDVEPWNPNLTTLVDFPSKWKEALDKEIPVPTPVAASRARIFRPSLPIILPFISSLGRVTTETVFSAT